MRTDLEPMWFEMSKSILAFTLCKQYEIGIKKQNVQPLAHVWIARGQADQLYGLDLPFFYLQLNFSHIHTIWTRKPDSC